MNKEELLNYVKQELEKGVPLGQILVDMDFNMKLEWSQQIFTPGFQSALLQIVVRHARSRQSSGPYALDVDVDLRIEQLHPGYHGELKALVEKNVLHLGLFAPELFERHGQNQKKIVTTLLRDMYYPRNLTLLIFLEERVVGVLTLATPYGVPTGFSLGFWVDLDHHRQGIMSRSLSALIDDLSSRGVQALFANIHPSNTASIQLVSKLNFEFVGLNPEHGMNSYIKKLQ